MYLREVHAEKDIATLQSFVLENPLGILTTAITSSKYPLLQCTHIPWVYDVNEEGLGVLRGHLARNNPHAKAMIEAIAGFNTALLQEEVMVLFNAPHHSYVTPQFYVQSKPADGKVVPTWNYAAAQIYGRATIYSKDSEFILQQVNDLTDQEEAREGKERTWKVEDAPERYINLLSKAIIGIKIEVTRLEGKYKMSQEMGAEDRQGVIDGFEAKKTDLGRAMAKTIKERGGI
jgi:transcriptional regulator